MTPLAGWPHGQIGATLIRLLDEHVRSHNHGIVLGSRAGFDLPTGDTVEPDVSFLSCDRLAAGPQPERGQFLRIVPSLVVEILSRATARRDRTEKKDLYERNGVNEYWIVDPDHQEVTGFPLRGAAYDAGRSLTAGSLGVTGAAAAGNLG